MSTEEKKNKNDACCPKYPEIPITQSLVDHISGALIRADVNLLALALSSARIDDAKALIADVKTITAIDLTVPTLCESLEKEEVVDTLQAYETTARSRLITLIQQRYGEQAVNDQKSVLRVRYNKFRMLYGASITAFACAYMLYITTRDLSYADTVLGFLMGTLVGTVVTFYFGSSAKQGDLAENEVVKERYNYTTSPNAKKDEK